MVKIWNLLQTVDSNGEGGRTGRSAKGCRKSRTHWPDKSGGENCWKNDFYWCLPEWKLSSDHRVDDGKDDESLGGDAKADGNQVPVQHHMLPLKAIYQKHIGRMLVKLQEIGYDIRIKGSR